MSRNGESLYSGVHSSPSVMLVSQCSEHAPILGNDFQINKLFLFADMLTEKEVVNFNTSFIDSP